MVKSEMRRNEDITGSLPLSVLETPSATLPNLWCSVCAEAVVLVLPEFQEHTEEASFQEH